MPQSNASLAIDLVLLPPDHIIEAVLEENKKAVDEGVATIELNAVDRIPHISLLMGVIPQQYIEPMGIILNQIASKTAPLELSFDTTSGSSIVTPNSGAIRELHETIVKYFNPLLSHDARVEDFDDDSSHPFFSQEDPFHWPNTFVTEHSHDNFNPHITVHSPTPEQITLPLNGTFTRLAICSLGGYCTCRRVLLESELRD